MRKLIFIILFLFLITTQVQAATIKFNPSGTHIHKGELKVRIDLYPAQSSPLYAVHYVDHFDREPTKEEMDNPELLALIPTHKELNPMLSHFITISEDTTKEELLNYVRQIFTPENLKSLEAALVMPDAIHRVSPFMKNKSVLKPVKAKNISAIETVNRRFSGLTLKGQETATKGIPIEPQSIDVGPGAIDRASTGGGPATLIDKNNPANADGTLDTFEIWAYNQLTSVDIATAYVVSGNNLTSRDTESIGTVNPSSKQTFSGLNVSVLTNDYLALDWVNTGALERDTTGDGIWWVASEQIPFTNYAFASVGSRTYSIYGTGTETTVWPAETQISNAQISNAVIGNR